MKRILNTPDSWNEAGRDGVVGCRHGGHRQVFDGVQRSLGFR
jgi:hypothetical protein